MRRSLLALACAVLSLAAAAAVSAAEFKVSTWADSQSTGTGGLVDNPPPDTDETTSATPGVSVTSSSGASLTNLWDAGSAAWNGTGNASAMVDTTGIHVYAAGSAEVIDGQPFFSQSTRGDAIADGEFTDTFVLQANGISAGTFLRARAEIVVDSLLTASANDVDYAPIDEVWGGSSWFVTVRIRANGFTQLDTFFRSPDCVHRLATFPTALCSPSSAREVVYFDVPVGGITEVRLHGTVQAGGLVTLETGGYASAGGTANLSNTVEWGGVLELRTQSDEIVTDYSMVSAATGVDYRYAQTVPEPGAAFSVASAIAALALARRARRRGFRAAPTR